MRAVTLASRPDLAEAVYAIPCPADSPRFMRAGRRSGRGHRVVLVHRAATLARWRAWTGLPFDRDGPVAVPGAPGTVHVSTSQNVAVYVEPSVWVSHTVPTG